MRQNKGTSGERRHDLNSPQFQYGVAEISDDKHSEEIENI